MTIDKRQSAALNNARTALKPDAIFPGNVFSKPWSKYLFCMPDWFNTEFSGIVHDLMLSEGSTSACLVNLDRLKPVPDEDCVFYFYRNGESGDFKERLWRGDEGWIYSLGQFVCISDRGGWCLYWEGVNDVAVVAISAEPERFREQLQQLNAKPLSALVDPNSGGYERFFGEDMIEQFHADLFANYHSS